jgi:predicted ATPase with chaperone activity
MHEVEIEVHAGWGNTDKIAVAGLPDTAVKESSLEPVRSMHLVTAHLA